MKVYRVTSTQYNTLLTTGSITVNGVKYTYDVNNFYYIVDYTIPEYTITTDTSENAIVLYKDGTFNSSADVSQLEVQHAHNADESASIYYTDTTSGATNYIYGQTLQTKLDTIDTIQASLDGKLDKATSGSYQVYGIDGSGTGATMMYTVQTNTPSSYTLVQRGAGGVITVGTPTANNHATTKKYVDDIANDFVEGSQKVYSAIHDGDGNEISTTYATKDELDGKLDKNTTTGTYTVYGVSNGAQKMYNVVSASFLPDSIVQRTSTGQILTNNPTADYHAVNRSYLSTWITTATINTNNLTEPSRTTSSVTPTMQAKLDITSADRFACMPTDRMILQHSIDGGETWTTLDSSIYLTQGRSLFTGNQDSGIQFPKIDGKQSPLSMIRVTITGMAYNVPAGTSMADKYNYWNKDYATDSILYCTISDLYFWLTSAENRVQIVVEGATGANPNTWVTFATHPNANGWSGPNQLKISPTRGIGGGTTQTSNYWNWRFTFRQVGTNGETDGTNFTASSSTASIAAIRGYGDSLYYYGNYMSLHGKPFRINNNYDFVMQNGNYLPTRNDYYSFGASNYQWNKVFSHLFYENGVLLTNKYVAKVTTTSDFERAYIINSNGTNTTMNVDVNASNNTIAKRNEDGHLMTTTPTYAYHCANKEYVDDVNAIPVIEMTTVLTVELANKIKNHLGFIASENYIYHLDYIDVGQAAFIYARGYDPETSEFEHVNWKIGQTYQQASRTYK